MGSKKRITYRPDATEMLLAMIETSCIARSRDGFDNLDHQVSLLIRLMYVLHARIRELEGRPDAR